MKSAQVNKLNENGSTVLKIDKNDEKQTIVPKELTTSCVTKPLEYIKMPLGGTN